jgi:hypothetical protein
VGTVEMTASAAKNSPPAITPTARWSLISMRSTWALSRSLPPCVAIALVRAWTSVSEPPSM